MGNLDEGIYAAALTPMRADLSCDHKKLAEHCFSLVEQGCKGIALFGTTGEGASFSVSERTHALEKLIQAGFDHKKLIVANGSSCIPDTIKLGEAALRLGCAALLISPPSFYKNVKEEGVIAFYRTIIQKLKSPSLSLLLYHIPQLTGVPISLKVIEILRDEFPEIVVGIKESEGNLALSKAILKNFPGFKLYVGNEAQIIETVQLGGAGSICGIANLFPKLIVSLFTQGKKALHANPESLDAIFKALETIPFIPAAKAVMEKREGDSWHTLRAPLTPLNDQQREQFFSALQKAHL
jgi:4-hydroxy-tetrahydrodipicolinate synthase